ncbi:MAG: FmdE family protein [Pseudomonadota bacterium]
MDLEITDQRLKDAISFHGHLCPGLLIGYRAARLGLEMLGGKRSEDEEMIAVVENDSCSVDAVQALTGCTFGKGNLVFRDWGKQVFTLAYRPDGRGVRLAFKGDRIKPTLPEGGADRPAFIKLLLESPDELLFDVKPLAVDLPRAARIFPTIPCDICGEGVMEPRLSEVEGRKICPACLLEQPSGEIMGRVADFMFELGMLKKAPRTGYQFLGNGHETVAAHVFRTAVIGFVLARLVEGVDPHKVLKMCLFHDLAEARTGDHNYVNKQYVVVDEARAERDAAAQVPSGREIQALLAEFRQGESPEALLASDADQLDMIVELKEKQDLGNQYAAAWLFYAEKRLKTDAGRNLCRAVMKTDWTHWWFDKKEHLWVRNE